MANANLPKRSPRLPEELEASKTKEGKHGPDVQKGGPETKPPGVAWELQKDQHVTFQHFSNPVAPLWASRIHHTSVCHLQETSVGTLG